MEQLVSMIRFPMFLNLQNKKVFLCGDGIEIVDKIEKMKGFGPDIYVFSEGASSCITSIENIKIIHRFIKDEDFEHMPVLVIASCEEEKNKKIWQLCKRYKTPVNIIDHPELCDFTFPALVTTKKVCVGISSSGVSPTTAIHLKNKIETMLPSQIDDILDVMIDIRTWVHMWCKDRTRCNEILRLIVEEAFQKNRPLTEKELEKIKEQFMSR